MVDFAPPFVLEIGVWKYIVCRNARRVCRHKSFQKGGTAYVPDTLTPQTGKQKTILLAEHAGFCHGVEKAVRKALTVGEQSDRPVYVLGQLIHNQQVIDHLADKNIQTVTSLDEVPQGSLCVIRTHGAPPETVEAAQAKGVDVADATCPDVSLVQKKAIQLAEEGYTVVVVGKAEHPEIIGIMAHSKRVPGANIVAINRVEDIGDKLKGLPCRRIGIVSQTTQMEDAFFDMVREVSKIAKELKVFNTICPATYFRQSAAEEKRENTDQAEEIGETAERFLHVLLLVLERAGPHPLRAPDRPVLVDEPVGDLGIGQAQEGLVLLLGGSPAAVRPRWSGQSRSRSRHNECRCLWCASSVSEAASR